MSPLRIGCSDPKTHSQLPKQNRMLPLCMLLASLVTTLVGDVAYNFDLEYLWPNTSEVVQLAIGLDHSLSFWFCGLVFSSKGIAGKDVKASTFFGVLRMMSCS